MKKIYFITGTDTGIGKTYVTTQLLQQFNQQGLKTVGLKPVASGGIITASGLQNEDAIALQQHASIKLPYEIVNPILFQEPIAPHIAAKQENRSLNVELILKACEPGLTTHADIILIEGVGGWLTPLNEQETMADFVKALNIPVILVSGIRLGCLNHTLLTYHHIQQSGVICESWVANCLDSNMLAQKANIDFLKSALPVPLLRQFI